MVSKHVIVIKSNKMRQKRGLERWRGTETRNNPPPSLYLLLYLTFVCSVLNESSHCKRDWQLKETDIVAADDRRRFSSSSSR